MIVVVGAGPAGLSTAFHLEPDHVVLERESKTGGLCRSFTLEGCVFDLGGHAFFTRHEHVRQLVERLCDGDLHRQPRSAWVYSHGHYLPYPFQSNLYGLPVDVVRDCLVGAVERFAAPASECAPNLDTWIDQAFGRGVAEHFMRPYNAKLWAHPLDDIVPSWVGERVVQPSVVEMIDGALRRNPTRDFPNAEVLYPAAGGFAELYRGFLTKVAPRLRRGTVTAVDLEERTVSTAEGDQYRFDELVSTMPLTALVTCTRAAPPRLRELASTLVHNSLLLVNLVVDRPAVTDMHRIYVADPSIPFHKLVMNSNSSPELRAGPYFGIQAEISYSQHKPVSEVALVERVADAVRRIGIIESRDGIVASSIVRVPHAYPISAPGSHSAVAELREFYARHGVHLVGRFGEWAYINSDEAVHRGWELAQALNAANLTLSERTAR